MEIKRSRLQRGISQGVGWGLRLRRCVYTCKELVATPAYLKHSVNHLQYYKKAKTGAELDYKIFIVWPTSFILGPHPRNRNRIDECDALWYETYMNVTHLGSEQAKHGNSISWRSPPNLSLKQQPPPQSRGFATDASPTKLSSKVLRIRGKASEGVLSASRWCLQLSPDPIHHERPSQLRTWPCHYVVSVFPDGTPRAFRCKHSAYATCQKPDPSENHSTVASS